MKRLINKDLTKSERVITQTIISLGYDLRDMWIEDLSSTAQVSNSLVVKYAKKLGFSGFKELKYYVLSETAIKQPLIQTTSQNGIILCPHWGKLPFSNWFS